MSTRKLTDLQLSGIAIPARADDTVSVRIAPEAGSSDLQRTVNGDLIQVARRVFRKYQVSVSGTGINLPALAPVWPGKYVEIVAPDPISLTPGFDGLSATWNRAASEVHGRTADGIRVEPEAQPASVLPLHETQSTARLIELRATWSVTFPTPVVIVFARPILACLLADWSTDNEDASKSASWSLDLLEV